MALIRRIISVEYTEEELEELSKPPVSTTDDSLVDLVEVEEPTPTDDLVEAVTLEPITIRSGYRYTPPTSPLIVRRNQSICITGKFDLATREELQSTWLRPVRIYMNNLPRNCSYLIVARTSGVAKIRAAVRDRIPIYSERDFLISLADLYDAEGVAGSAVLRAAAANALTPLGITGYIRGA